MSKVLKRFVVIVIVATLVLVPCVTAFAQETINFKPEDQQEVAPVADVNAIAETPSLQIYNPIPTEEYDASVMQSEELLALQNATGVEAFVSRFYLICLGRPVDETGLREWSKGLVDGTSSAAKFAQGIVNSTEFQNKNYTDSAFVDIMYFAFFNRPSDEGGKQGWVDALDKGYSRNRVLSGFINSDEFGALCAAYGITKGEMELTLPSDQYPDIGAFVTRFYKLCLGRAPDNTGLQDWVSALIGGKTTGTDVAKGFVFSKEFVDKRIVNTDFIEIMYLAFFGRNADPGGFSAWVEALDEGTDRNDVMAGFTNSAEFTGICSSYGIQRGTMDKLPPYPLPGRPAAPTISSISSNGSAAVINIAPAAGSSVTAYEIWWVYQPRSAMIIGVTTTNQYIDEDVKKGRSYEYYVKAVKEVAPTQLTRSYASDTARVTI